MFGTNGRRSGKGKKLVLLAFVLTLLGGVIVASAAYADFQLTDELESYDDASGRWENGNLTLYLNGENQPFSEVLRWNTTPVVDACGPGTSTPYAGTFFIALMHTDTNGADGFQSTANWQAVDCTTFSTQNSTQKYPTADETLSSCTIDNGDDVYDGCEIVQPTDVITDCTTGNCQDVILTAVRGNLDLDCDGSIDDYPPNPSYPDRPLSYYRDLVDAGALCWYFEGVKPPFPLVNPVWTGNMQGAISADQGGAKTVNFSNILGPNAVTLTSFAAQPTSIGLVTGAAVLLSLGIVVLLAAGYVFVRAIREP